MNFAIVRGDELPHLTATLTQSRAPIDLTNCTVEFEMVPVAGGASIGGACVVDSPTAGTVHYVWQPGDTDAAGSYQGQFRVTYGTGDVITVPTIGVITISIEPRVTD